MNKILLLILALSLLGFIFIALYYYYSLQKSKKMLTNLLGKKTDSKYKWKEKANVVAQKAYNYSMRIPLLNTIILRVRRRIETMSIYDEYSLRREVMKIVFTVFSAFALGAVLVLVIRPGYLIAFWIFIGMFFVAGLLIDHLVYRVEVRLLNQLKEFNNRVRFFYQQSKMVDEAFFESIAYAGNEMKVQAEYIHSILTSLTPNEDLSKYEEVAPTRFLKVLAGLALTVKEEGDVITDKGSAFLSGMTAINVEINSEMLYRQKLAYRLRGLSTLALAPIFLALPIKTWAVSTFPIMASFYNSRIGFFAEVITYGLAVLSYIMIRKIKDASENKYYMSLQKNRWEQKVLDKFPFLLAVIQIFKPKQYSKREYKLKELIKAANSPLTIDSISLRRTLLSVLMFLLLFTGLIYSHHRDKTNALYGAESTSFFAGNVTEQEKAALVEETEFDRHLLMQLQHEKNVTMQTVQKYVLKSINVKDPNTPKAQEIIQRVSMKWNVIHGAFIKWWEVIIAFALVYVTSLVPLLILHYQKVLRQKDMENEVYQYLILIGILKEFESMSVFKILNWIERFSVIFKTALQEAILEYDAGPDETLKKLKEQVSFEPFQQMVERLELAVIRISVQEAFEDIAVEREYYVEQRNERDERSLNIRSFWGTLISWVPTTALVALYLVIPIIYISIIKSKELVTQIQT
ncbi:hypothetical protein [Rummeliibacillus stabekisii]|uniref:hypothetical protein n=1 Tax=Rummeliibacillus stabekisii TaxID=241244 RepID=UPI00117169C0|nr:hypothetical protein [Rummeliibacillus stabekisii]MBB5171589.1 hypothetical protein [Rummeliibacillus stabekisii]GEL05557.1 hypothetical protein RST01_21840 [Rummeliibacillus stabekisii]